MLEAFVRELRAGTPAELTRAARRAQVFAFLVLAAPGLPLGALYLLTRPAPLPPSWVAALVLLGALLAWVALRLAHQVVSDAVQPPARRVLTAAIQAATAPAVPFLLGCVCLHQPAALAALWLVAALAYAAARARIPGWVKAAQPGRG
ncbi:hypothetical protein [Deinococcus sp. YIM 77859]|uniref:hypothetical protein n=1 Tax=Deinococcus sp. YIM 77859 TaxID=1540221 RepID=UPI000554F644|nr:hypothetical protein [Deinococcus sp. YIM 77859]